MWRFIPKICGIQCGSHEKSGPKFVPQIWGKGHREIFGGICKSSSTSLLTYWSSLVRCHCWSFIDVDEIKKKYSKMQSDAADFSPGAATWRAQPNNVVWRPTGANIWRAGWDMGVVFNTGPFAPLGENVTSSTKQEVNNILHFRQEDRARSTTNMYRKLGMFSEIHKPTDRPTDWSQYFVHLPTLNGYMHHRVFSMVMRLQFVLSGPRDTGLRWFFTAVKLVMA